MRRISVYNPRMRIDLTHRGSIALYDGGRFLGMRTATTIEALYSRNLIQLRRNAKGYLVAADVVHLAQVPEETHDARPDCRLKPPLTPRYSFRDNTITARPWDLRRLNGHRGGINYAPASVIPDFTAVIRSVSSS
ncbi:MAG TPA: hypothetical protein VFD98_09060 [Terracidiphilus sp.]|nr:hypothetical protein [Terracidiphilus sp.]